MIKFNKAKCLICGDIIESKHRHNYVACSCGNLSVDGGLDYLKRSAFDMSAVEELSCKPDCFLGEDNEECTGYCNEGDDEPVEECKLCPWCEGRYEE